MPVAKCVNEIASNKLAAKPGTTFNYGNTHLQVAGRMAEVVSGKDFLELFKNQLADILGWEKSVRYYTFPRKKMGTQPLLAGGLNISTNDYIKFLQMLSQKGVFNGKRILSENIIAEMEKDQFKSDTKVINSPMILEGVSVHYGLGHWVESKDVQSSGGAFGFFPWIDRKNKYLAVYATVGEPRTAQKSYAIVRALRPTIEKLIK
jgi:CubicO group peptidase (beta-lactamase class C family)